MLSQSGRTGNIMRMGTATETAAQATMIATKNSPLSGT
jgi:hypothetical protein